MNSVIAFPAPKAEHYTIDYDPVSHKVDIPLIPDDPTDAACILAVLIDMLVEEGTLTGNDVCQVVLQIIDREE